MTNGADFQQQQELLEQQRLLTKKSFTDWLDANCMALLLDGNKRVDLREKYLREHGLPLNSKIEGL